MRIGLACVALLAATATLSTTALALEDDHGSARSISRAHRRHVGQNGLPDGAEQGDDADSENGPKLGLEIDWVLGFGKITAVEQKFPGSLQRDPINVSVVAPYRVQSYVLGAHYRFESFGLGLRLPLTVGNIRDAAPGTTGENVFTNGGLEIALDMSRKMSETVTVSPRLGLVAPIAQGDAAPASLAGASVDKYALYKYTANVAAAMARGNEDDALFWPGRLGVVPSASAHLAIGAVSIDPYAKLPVLVDVHATSTERVRVEAVAGVSAGFDATSWLEPGLRVWAMVPIAAESGMRDPVAVVEPHVRLHSSDNAYGLLLGGVVPFAGALTNPYAGGVRASLAAKF